MGNAKWILVVLALWGLVCFGALFAFAGPVPNPVPTLRPATPGEIPNLCEAEKVAVVKAKFLGLVIPPECAWSFISPLAGCSRFNLMLSCAPMVLRRP